MAIDNQFRINELIASGSRAIISKDEVTGNHTFVQGSKEIVTTPYEHLKGERDGEQTGRIEKPKYNEEELVKAVDTKVDELIGPPKKPQPDVVPKPVYDDLRRLYNEALATISELENQVTDLEALVASLQSEVEALRIENDALNMRTATAENEAQAATQRYSDLLQDFSNAIIKGTRDAIERVSLKAQVEGLRAQKETLREQLKSLNLLVSQLQAQIEAQNIRQASESALDGQPGSFDEVGNTGYKIPQGEFIKEDRQIYLETENDNRIRVKQGTGLNLYNFNEEEATFNISVAGDANKFLEVPRSITLPARVDATPGVGHIKFRWKPLGRTSPRKSTTSGTVEIKVSTGENFSIKAEYWKETRRRDTWRPFGSTRAVVGSEL